MRRLSGWDAYMLYSETPTVHNHTLKVAVVAPDAAGHTLTFAGFRRTLADYLPQLDPLRFRLVKVPAALHHPMWRENCRVDLDFHLSRIEVAPPGDRAALDATVGSVASIPLARDAPLWSFHFVEGLSGGRVAIVAKVHHALADGLASANLLARAVTRAPEQASPEVDAGSDLAPDRQEVLRAAMRDHGRTMRQLPAVLAQTATGVIRTVRHAEAPPAGDARPMHAPATFLNRRLGEDRAFGTATLDLPTVKAVGKRLGITINDVVLALVAGSLRDLFLARSEPPVPLVGAVAVATDRDPNRISGNHLAALMVSLPTDESDPLARCRRVQRSTAVAKHNLDLLGVRLVERWMEYAPPRTSAKVFQLLAERNVDRNRFLNLPLSNVPGPREPGFVAGFPLEQLYSVGPLYSGCGVNITVWSYCDQLNISVLSDPGIVSEPAAVAQSMFEGLQELREAVLQ